jgi:hypothetical protein
VFTTRRLEADRDRSDEYSRSLPRAPTPRRSEHRGSPEWHDRSAHHRSASDLERRTATSSREASRPDHGASASAREDLEHDLLGSACGPQFGAFHHEISEPERLESRRNHDHRRPEHEALAFDHEHAGQNELSLAADREEVALDHERAGQNELSLAADREEVALDHQRVRQNEL